MDVSRPLKAIDADDDRLAAIVDQLGLVVLLMSVVHMTGSLRALCGAVRPGPLRFSGDMSGGIDAETAATLRSGALDAIRAYRDAGSPTPYQPTPDELLEMVSFMTGAELPAKYLAPILEEAGFLGDARAFRWTRLVHGVAKQRHPVLIIGAGMSGIAVAIRLKEAGIPFRIVEKNDSAGGTWHENRYPGCRVDVPSYSYSFSFTPGYRWPNLFSQQAELERYFLDCIERFGLASHISYGVEALRADYSEEDCCWSVQLRDRAGAETVERPRALISAVGFFNHPLVPAFDGDETFRGQMFHTSRWPADVVLKGKRIAVIGNAATGLQAIPELAKIADRLTVFQRSPQWMSINPEYHRPITDAENWALDHLPYYAQWMRTQLSNWPNDREPHHMKVDAQWPQDGQAVSAANAYVRERYLDQIRASFADRPDLVEKVTPRYPPFVKRPCVTGGGFYEALKRDNVELVTNGIDRFVEQGIVDKAGRLHTADIVVLATGFDVQKFVSPIEFHGRDGVELHDLWGDAPGGYLGITVPNFPNLYLMYGPGTNLGYNGNLVFNSECQATYITRSIRHLIEHDLDAWEVRPEVFADYLARFESEVATYVWATDYGTTYFRNEAGRVTTNSPWSLYDYWSWTRSPNADEYRVWRCRS